MENQPKVVQSSQSAISTPSRKRKRSIELNFDEIISINDDWNANTVYAASESQYGCSDRKKLHMSNVSKVEVSEVKRLKISSFNLKMLFNLQNVISDMISLIRLNENDETSIEPEKCSFDRMVRKLIGNDEDAQQSNQTAAVDRQPSPKHSIDCEWFQVDKRKANNSFESNEPKRTQNRPKHNKNRLSETKFDFHSSDEWNDVVDFDKTSFSKDRLNRNASYSYRTHFYMNRFPASSDTD